MPEPGAGDSLLSIGAALGPWLLPPVPDVPVLLADDDDRLPAPGDLAWTGDIGPDVAPCTGVVRAGAPRPGDERAAWRLTVAPSSSGGRGRSWGLIVDRRKRIRLIDLSTSADLDALRPLLRKRRRYLPGLLLRSSVATVAVLDGATETRLDLAVRQACRNGRPAGPAYVQEKDKITVEMACDDGGRSFLKLPLSNLATVGLDQAADMLGFLGDLGGDHPLTAVCPPRPERIEAAGLHGWLEHGRPGIPLADRRTGDRGLRALGEAAALVGRMKDLRPSLPSNPAPDRADVLPAHLLDLAAGFDADARDVLQRILDALDRRRDGVHLRKGDMTLGNILVEDDAVTGLIDWDDCGLTHRPLADLADLVLSWTWRREGMPRAETMAWLLDPDGGRLDSGFDLDELLKRADGDREEFSLSLLQSWLDHAHVELLHPRSRARAGRAESLLLAPLRAVAPVLSRWIP